MGGVGVLKLLPPLAGRCRRHRVVLHYGSSTPGDVAARARALCGAGQRARTPHAQAREALPALPAAPKPVAAPAEEHKRPKRPKQLSDSWPAPPLGFDSALCAAAMSGGVASALRLWVRDMVLQEGACVRCRNRAAAPAAVPAAGASARVGAALAPRRQTMEWAGPSGIEAAAATARDAWCRLRDVDAVLVPLLLQAGLLQEITAVRDAALCHAVMMTTGMPV